MAEFKDRLAEALAVREISAAELARRSGVSEGAISQYKSGAYKASQHSLERIAKILNVSIPWLIGADVPMDNKTVKIPVLGVIRAGIPIEAVQEIIDYEEITPALASAGRFFGLRVTGSSMAPRISEGDVVIVRQQATVDSGSVAIVLVNGSEATIKEIHLQDGNISLVPWNPAYRPQFFTAEQVRMLPVAIIGKVIEIRGKLE